MSNYEKCQKCDRNVFNVDIINRNIICWHCGHCHEIPDERKVIVSEIIDIIRHESWWAGKSIGGHLTDIIETINKVYKFNLENE